MKKRGKLSKAAALCLTLLMAISMFSTMTFAIGQDDTGTITVNNVEDGVTVSAYKLMDVSYDYTANQPVQPVYTWIDGVASWVRTNYPDKVGDTGYIGSGDDDSVKAGFSKAATADEIAAFYDKLAAAIKSGNPKITPETRTGSGNIEGLTMGNYLIIIENGMKVYRPSAVNLVPEWKDNAWAMTTPAVVEVKSSDMTITKTVNEKEADNANIGDTLNFKIEADVPKFPAKAIAKNYAISDILPAGLSLTEESIQVYGVSETGETTLTQDTDYTSGNTRPAGDTTATTFTFNFIYAQISRYEKIRITYTATLDSDAELGGNGNQNTAYLDYSNNPYTEESWKFTDDSATVYTYGLDISKVDKGNHQTFLAGAEFELYATQNNAENRENKIAFIRVSDGVYRKAMAEETGTTTLVVGSGANDSTRGKLTLKGLDETDWYLLETKAPNGYNLLASPIKVTITDADGDALDGKVSGAAVDAEGEAVALVTLFVENDDGFRLPVTGGMGTILFTAIGVVLMGTALILMVIAIRKKKGQ